MNLLKNKRTLLLLSLLSFNSILYGQFYTEEQEKVQQQISQIESVQQQPDSLLLKMDSIIINIARIKNKYTTNSYFVNSNTNLIVNFFFKEENLIMVYVEEQSRKFNDLKRFSSYYISNNKINSRHHSGLVKEGVTPMNVDHCVIYGYNKTFSAAFIEQYMAELLTDIKLQPSGAWRKMNN